jgi:hypothetical protein
VRPRLPAAAAAAAAASPALGGSDSSSDGSSAASSGQLTAGELWALLRPDSLRLLGCVAFTALSAASYVCIAPCLGAVVDAISAGTAGIPSTLALRLGLLGAAYLGTAAGLAVQVRVRCAAGCTPACPADWPASPAGRARLTPLPRCRP